MYEIPCVLFFGFRIEREESIDLVKRVIRQRHGEGHKYANEEFWDELEYKYEVGAEDWSELESERPTLYEDLVTHGASRIFRELRRALSAAHLPLQIYFPEHLMRDHNRPMDPQIYIAQGNHIELAANGIYYAPIKLGKEREWAQQLEDQCNRIGIPFKIPSYEFIGPSDLMQRWNAYFIYGVKLERAELSVFFRKKVSKIIFERTDIEDSLISDANEEWESQNNPLYLKSIDSGVGRPPNYFLGIRETFSGFSGFSRKTENLFLFDPKRLYNIQKELVGWNRILQTVCRKRKLNHLKSPHLYVILWTDSY